MSALILSSLVEIVRRINMKEKQKGVFFVLVLGVSLCFHSTAFAGYYNNGPQKTYSA
jgi:hypothetical protein